MRYRRIFFLFLVNLKFILNVLRYRSNRYPLKGVTCVIFSRNRALQLDALLRSIEKYSKSSFDIIIQYSCSSNHRNSYEVLKERFNRVDNCKFVEEQSFPSTLIEVIKSIKTQIVFFLVDDQVFVRPFNIEDVITLVGRKSFFSLRLGRTITDFGIYEMKLAPNYIIEDKYLTWSWKKNKSQKDWGYQFSVDGTVYRSIDVLRASMAIPFKAPNSYEDNMNSIIMFRGNNKGISYYEPVVINLIINASRQEKEYDNFESGEYSIDDMLELWELGKKFSIDEISKIRFSSTHYIIRDINTILAKKVLCVKG